ncbi:MAG TPA: hypothetical protein VEK08_18905 [Planctomycetota bacterium]|nr:hypothetical protein [Planctomycetota bacterium]
MSEANPSEATLNAESSIECPACGAVLRNVSAEQSLRCLNCGKRITAQREEAPAEVIAARPQSPGYWLLRIPATILLIATSALAAVIVWNELPLLIQSTSLRRINEFLYVALLPFTGAALHLIARAFNRLDAASVYWAWKRGCIRDALPAPEGSSLPFIAPLAVSGGLTPIIVLTVSGNTEARVVVIAGIFGALGVMAGFALEDLRQFCSRQLALARACCAHSRIIISEIELRRHARIGAATLAVTSGCMGLCAFATAWRMLRWTGWSPDWLIFLSVGFLLCAASYSFYRVNLLWNEAVTCWRMAAKNPLGSAAGLPLGISWAGFAAVCSAGIGMLLIAGLVNMRSRNVVAAGVAGIIILLVVAIAFLWRDARRVSVPYFSRDIRIPGTNVFIFASALIFCTLLIGDSAFYFSPTASLALLVASTAALPMAMMTVQGLLFSERMPGMSGLMRLAVFLPLLWMCLGSVVLIVYLRGLPYGMETEDTVVFHALWISLASLAMWLSRFLLQVWRWRCALHVALLEPVTAKPSLPLLALPLAILTKLACAFVLVQALLLTTLFQTSSSLMDYLGLALLIPGIHFPPLWLAMLLSEIALNEKQLEIPRESDA